MKTSTALIKVGQGVLRVGAFTALIVMTAHYDQLSRREVWWLSVAISNGAMWGWF